MTSRTGTTGTMPSPAKIIVAACVGNALEWYDIAVYSYFAVYIANVFFPSADPTVSLILALGTFGVSFLIRPLGALVLGSYADSAGRRPALTLTLMMLGTLLICIMPSYALIGIIAPIGILVARLLQGFAAGGEFGSATAMMVEHLPNRRGFAASWQFASQAVSSLLAAGIGTILTSTLTAGQLNGWGFRIPFIVGLLVGPVGLYIRQRVPEPADTATALPVDTPKTPIRTMFKRHKLGVLLTIGVLAVTTCLNYMITYIPTYAIETLGLPGFVGFAATLVAAAVLLVVTPFAGHFSDKVGQFRLMLPAALLILVLIYPMFGAMVAWPALGVLLIMLFFMALFKASYYGPMPSLMAEIFPRDTRATGMAVGYNIGVTIFGGLTPMIATWLIASTGTDLAPSFWIIFAAAVSTASLVVIWYRMRNHTTASGDTTDDCSRRTTTTASRT